MGERKKIESFEDLEVYQKLLELHLEISEISLKFPKHELYELGSQNHLQVAYRKGYINKDTYLEYRQRYEECAKMLRGLESALRRWKAKKGER
jgi:hypothetical protein